MPQSISFSPYLGWVDITDPNNIPAEARIITAADLLRYENLGKNVHDFTVELNTDLATMLGAKQDTIPAGTAAQYYRGDKTMATLNKAAVGLGNVDNTSDLLKPISTATQNALNAKVDDSQVGSANGLATLDANGYLSAAHQRRYLGKHTVTVNASPGGTLGITFNGVTFSTPPLVFVTKQTGGMAKYVPYVVNVTATGCTIGLYAGDGSSGSGTAEVAVMAVQV